MSGGRPVFDASTRGWGFEEWAHEANINRSIHEDRERRRREQMKVELGRLANDFARYEKLRRLEEGETDD